MALFACRLVVMPAALHCTDCPALLLSSSAVWHRLDLPARQRQQRSDGRSHINVPALPS